MLAVILAAAIAVATPKPTPAPPPPPPPLGLQVLCAKLDNGYPIGGPSFLVDGTLVLHCVTRGHIDEFGVPPGDWMHF